MAERHYKSRRRPKPTISLDGPGDCDCCPEPVVFHPKLTLFEIVKIAPKISHLDVNSAEGVEALFSLYEQMLRTEYPAFLEHVGEHVTDPDVLLDILMDVVEAVMGPDPSKPPPAPSSEANGSAAGSLSPGGRPSIGPTSKAGFSPTELGSAAFAADVFLTQHPDLPEAEELKIREAMATLRSAMGAPSTG